MRKLLSLFALWTMLLSQSPAQVQMDRINAAGVNGIINTGRFPGADIGAQINNAIASSACATPCSLYVPTPGTISTSPNVPVGYTITFAPGTYTLATTFMVKHHGTKYEFNGAQFNYNQDTASAAFLISKNLTGTVNVSGSTVTWVSGSTFSDFDTGDQILVAGNTYNVAAVVSSTQLTLTAPGSSATGAAYSAFMSQNGLGSNYGPITLNNLIVNRTGTSATTSQAYQMRFVDGVTLNNAQSTGFSNGYGFLLRGVLNGHFSRIKSIADRFGIYLDQWVEGGSTISSNKNAFISWLVNAGPASGNPCVLQNGAFGNSFEHGDAEGNRGTIFCVIQTSAQNNLFLSNDLERNGDGTVNSIDFAVTAPNNIFIANISQSDTLNFPASGIIASTAATGTTVAFNQWTGLYSTAYNFIAGATGVTIGNTPGAAAIGEPKTAFPTSGNGKLNSLSINGGTALTGQSGTGANILTNTSPVVTDKITSPIVALTANISWTSGAGVPSAGTCTAANGGSLFSRTDGTTTTTLYVCDNSTHVWTAK